MLSILLVFFTLNGTDEYYIPYRAYKSSEACVAAQKSIDKNDLVPVGATQLYTECISFNHPDFDLDDSKPDEKGIW